MKYHLQAQRTHFVSPDANAYGHWNYTFRPNGQQIHDNLFIPCKDQDIDLFNITNSFLLESHLPKPVNLSSCLSRFSTSLQVSTSEPPHVQTIRNNPFLPHPYEQEFPVPSQAQNLPQIQQPIEDFSYQTNEHHQVHRHLELLEDVVAGNFDCTVGTNHIPVLPPLESHQYGVIPSNNENSQVNEIGGVANGSLASKIITEELFDTNHTSSGAEVSNKSRIRWTQELHDCFMRAVTDLGGPDRATPKNIMIKMGVTGLTICQVKSHLQKFRLARHQQQSKEDKGSSTSEGQKKTTSDKEENSNPTFAKQNSEILRMQWELQKRLHDQLEFQKEVQLQAEKNALQLEKLLEEQKRVGEAFVLATQSCSASTSTPLPSLPCAIAKTNGISRKGDKHRDQNAKDADSAMALPSTSQKKARLNTSEDSIVNLLSVLSNTSP